MFQKCWVLIVKLRILCLDVLYNPQTLPIIPMKFHVVIFFLNGSISPYLDMLEAR